MEYNSYSDLKNTIQYSGHYKNKYLFTPST